MLQASQSPDAAGQPLGIHVEQHPVHAAMLSYHGSEQLGVWGFWQLCQGVQLDAPRAGRVGACLAASRKSRAYTAGSRTAGWSSVIVRCRAVAMLMPSQPACWRQTSCHTSIKVSAAMVRRAFSSGYTFLSGSGLLPQVVGGFVGLEA